MNRDPLWKSFVAAGVAFAACLVLAYSVARFVPWSAARTLACDHYSIDFEFCEES